MEEFNEVDFYKRYAGIITCAYAKDIYADSEGVERCGAKRTEEREKYIFNGLTEEMVLIECPSDILTIEFENHTNNKEDKNIVSKEKLKEWIKQTYKNASDMKIESCIVSHGGTSDYLYICNIKNLIENKERECKKELAKLIIPKEAFSFLDLSNLGKTLIPIINRPHWKKKKYNGTIHKIIEGTNPDKQKNKLPDIILQRIIDNEKPNFPKADKDSNTDINSIPLSSVISMSSLKKRGSEYQGANVWHGSSTGLNFMVSPSKNVWFCFRCNAGGSIAKAIALNKGIINSCNEDLSPEQFRQVLEIARSEYGLKKPEPKIELEDVEGFGRRRQIEDYWKKQPFFYDKSKIFYLWDNENKKWDISDEVDLANSIAKTLNIDTIDSKAKTEIISGFQQVGRKHKPKPIKKTWVQFKNRIYDIETGENFESTPEYFVRNPIPHNIGTSEETPKIDKLLSEWVGNKQELYEIIFYTISINKFMQRIFALCGGGSNGKGTFIKLVHKFIGVNNCVSSELKSLSEDKFEAAVLFGKLFCEMGEVSYDDLKNTNMIKKIAGEDMLSYQFKNKTPFSDDCTITACCLTNSLPITPDKSLGFYRKWKIIDFPNQFEAITKDLISEIPEEEFENLAFKCLKGLKELYETKKFTNEGNFEERIKKYEERSNPVMRFVEEYCSEEAGESVSLRDFANKVNEYLKSKHLRVLTANQIGKALRNEGFSVGNRKIDNISQVVILNLVLLENIVPVIKVGGKNE